MKKLILSFACLLSVQHAAHAMGNQQLTQLIVQSATQEAVGSVNKIEGVITDIAFLDDLFTMGAGHSEESFSFLAKNLKKSLSREERLELANALTELYNWYAKLFVLTTDVQALQTQAGQEALMSHQMEMFQMLQRPFFAAVALRVMEVAGQLESDPTALDDIKIRFSALMTNSLKHFKAELLAD